MVRLLHKIGFEVAVLAFLLPATAYPQGPASPQRRVQPASRAKAVDSPPAIEAANACVDDLDTDACRRALTLGLSPARAARVYVFWFMATRDAAALGTEVARPSVAQLRRAAARLPDDPIAQYALALALSETSGTAATPATSATSATSAEAATAYRRALALRPEWAGVRDAFADFLVRIGKPDEASALLAAAERENPTDTQLILKRAQTEIAAKQWDAARATLERLASLGDTPFRPWSELGSGLEKAGRKDDARSAFTRAAWGKGAEVIDRHQMAVSISGLGGWEESARINRDLLEREPSLTIDHVKRELTKGASDAADRYCLLYFNLAFDYRHLNRPEAAELAIAEGIKPILELSRAAPENVSLLRTLAYAYDHASKHADAAEVWARLVPLEPNQMAWRLRLVAALAQAGRLEQALTALGDPLISESTDGTVLNNRINLLEAMGRTDLTLPLYTRVLESGVSRSAYWVIAPVDREALVAAYTRLAAEQPTDAVVEYALASHLFGQDRKQEARAALQRAARKAPGAAWPYVAMGCTSAYERPSQALEALVTAERIDSAWFARSVDAPLCREQARNRLEELNAK